MDDQGKRLLPGAGQEGGLSLQSAGVLGTGYRLGGPAIQGSQSHGRILRPKQVRRCVY